MKINCHTVKHNMKYGGLSVPNVLTPVGDNPILSPKTSVIHFPLPDSRTEPVTNKRRGLTKVLNVTSRDWWRTTQRIVEDSRGSFTPVIHQWISSLLQKLPFITCRMVPPSYKLVYKPHEYYSYICHKP